MKRLLAIALLALPAPAFAQQVGDTVQILRQHQVSQQSEGSSSTSSNSDAMIERVTAVRPDGVELEYDVPQGGDGGWQFPVRVFRPAHGPLRLVDAKALDARVDGWLKQNGATRAACGHWVMSLNPFRVECDPQSVLKVVEGLQLEPEALRDGAPISVPEAMRPGVLVKKGERRFVAELEVDPGAVLREQVENDIATAEINGQKLSPEAARRVYLRETISGTITVTFDLDESGHVGRRTTVRKVQVKGSDGLGETKTVTEVLERRAAEKPPRDPNMV